MATQQEKVTPVLWFDDKAEEAADFYVAVFPNSTIRKVVRRTQSAPGDPGTVLTVEFELDGQAFIALNGGPEFTFTPAVSFFIDCADQAEVDYFWERLTEGGRPVQCGWLVDKYGLSWQVVPEALPRMLNDDDDEKSDAVMQAMLKMTKIDVAELQRAYDAAPAS